MNSRTFAVSLLLFGSGLCALVYQTVWLREFRLIFGASTAATAAVLGIFMGGLGVGSLLLGNRVERTRKPLTYYANLELGIAVAAGLTPFLVDLVRWLYSAMGGSLAMGTFLGTVARLVLSAVVLIVPTVLMGGTLPAAARSVTGSDDAGRRSLAWLYGINTLGAVTGAVLATFVVLEMFGNRMTLWSACAVNLIVAIIARSMGRSEEIAPAENTAPSAADAAAQTPPPRFVLLASAVAGFAFLLMELVWYRMLSPLLGGSTFTFGLILAVALLGIGLGGALYAVAGRRAGGTLAAFGWTCALEALFIAVPFALGDRLAVFAAHLRSLSSVGFGPQVLGWSLIISIVVLPAAIVAGFQFPLLVSLLGRGGKSVGRHVASAYALNTAGAITGSLAGGFGLLPVLTAPGAWKLVVLVLVALALAAALTSLREKMGRHFSQLGVAAAATAAVLLILLPDGPTAAWRHSGVGVGRSGLDAPTLNGTRERINQWRRFITWQAEGVESSVAISSTEGASFIVNGRSDGNIRSDAGTQVMGGLTGALLHGDVKSACVIGLGTGCTAGWLADVPGIERVDAMELEPAILHVAKVCELANRRVLENKRCNIQLGDARELLQTSRENYDLIFSEPSNPYRAGIASLFTTEFYETAKKRLKPGGLFLQWVQGYEIDGYALRMVFATLGGSFPHVESWTTQAGDFLLVASMEPRTWDVAGLRARCAQEPYKTALQRVWGTDSAEGLLARFVTGAAVTKKIAAAPGQVRNTDDNTLLEFAFARSVGRSSGFHTPDMLRLAAQTGAARPQLSGEVDWARVTEEQLANYTYERFPPPNPPGLSPEAAARQEVRQFSIRGSHAEAAALIREKNLQPLHSRDLLAFAHSLAEAGADEAMPFIERVKAFSPGEAAALTAMLQLRKKNTAECGTNLLVALDEFRRDPWPLVAIQTRAFETVTEYAAATPDAAPAFFNAMKTGPYPGHLAEASRRVAMIGLTQIKWRTGREVCATGYQIYGDAPEWNRAFLKDRYAFFKATGLGDAQAAADQLTEFALADSYPFGSGL